MTLFGETTDFWLRVRAVMQRARVSTPEQLEEKLNLTPPRYEVRNDVNSWVITERRPIFGAERVIAWADSKDDADRMCAAMRNAEPQPES